MLQYLQCVEGCVSRRSFNTDRQCQDDCVSISDFHPTFFHERLFAFVVC